MPVLRKVKRHWYHTTFYECPVCGAWEKLRERRYTPKPTDPDERCKYVIRYDYCDC